MNAPAALAHLVPDVHQRAVPAALIEALKARFGERCSTAMAVREQQRRKEGAASPPEARRPVSERIKDREKKK